MRTGLTLVGAILVVAIILVAASTLKTGGEVGEVEKRTLVAATIKTGLSTFDVIEAEPGLLDDLPVAIEVVRFTVPPQSLDAVAKGDAQLTVIPVELAAKLIQQTGGKVYIVALDNEMNQAILTRPDTGIQSPEDLRGKKVAAVVGSGTYALFTVFMKELYNLTVGPEDADVIVVNVGNPASVIDILVRGDVDAAVIWEPVVSLGVLEHGLVIVANYTELWKEYAGDKPAPMLVWVAREEVVKDGEILRAVLEAHKRAAEKWNQNEGNWTVMLLQNLYNLPADVAYMVWERDQMYTGLCIDETLLDSMLTLWDMAVKAGYIDQAPSPDNIITCSDIAGP